VYPPSYRRRRLRRVVVAAAFVALLGAAAAAWLFVVWPILRPDTAAPSPSASPAPSGPSPLPGCETAAVQDAARLGKVAWTGDGALTVLDLATCRQTVTVASKVEPPVRFSPDGRWLAFGDGRVVGVAGGSVTEPFGAPVQTWEWSPSEEVLAGVTERGSLLVARPGVDLRMLLPAGSGVRGVAFAPDGARVAVERVGTGIQVVEMASGSVRTIFPQPDSKRVPEVAGWSPDGRWVLFWRGPVGREPGPLDAAPAEGGPWVNVFAQVPAYRDFVSPCGTGMAIVGGATPAVSTGKQVLLTGPPAWSFHNLTQDFSRSWIWPACSPDGRWVAAVATPNQVEEPDFTRARALWLLAVDGTSRERLVPGGDDAPELPRWSRDGRTMLVVLRSGHASSSPGTLLLVEIDPASGHLVRTLDPLVELPPAAGPDGHQGWSASTDWHQVP
jgi:dipeptidyl aminopeptidase/acylaminoacyl peptidase